MRRAMGQSLRRRQVFDLINTFQPTMSASDYGGISRQAPLHAELVAIASIH